jgi:hypothetical protein
VVGEISDVVVVEERVAGGLLSTVVQLGRRPRLAMLRRLMVIDFMLICFWLVVGLHKRLEDN